MPRVVQRDRRLYIETGKCKQGKGWTLEKEGVRRGSELQCRGKKREVCRE